MRISAMLEPEEHRVAPPVELAANRDRCFQGGTIWGEGFYLDAEAAQRFLGADRDA